jgi:hypothetical protein
MAKPYESVFSAVLPAARSVAAVAAEQASARAEAPAQAQLREIELLIAQGDESFRSAKHAAALKAFKEARARIYRILYPGFDVTAYTLAARDRMLPTSAELEKSLIGASVAMLGVVRPETVAKEPPLAHATDVPIDRKLADLRRTGFREATDADGDVQIASENGIELLAEDKPDQAFAVMQQTLAEATAAKTKVDIALLGALELNLSSTALQLGDDEQAKEFSRARVQALQAQ